MDPARLQQMMRQLQRGGGGGADMPGKYNDLYEYTKYTIKKYYGQNN